MTLSVLCLDIEGGFGGSSRSLYFSLLALAGRVDATVWCAKAGPIIGAYTAAGRTVVVKPQMPRFTALGRLSRNLWTGALFLRAWLRSRTFRQELVVTADSVDLVHLNHESLIPLGVWLRGRTKTPVTIHLRTQPPPGPFSRLMGRMARRLSGVVFISENEEAHWSRLAGEHLSGRVIYNIATPPAAGATPLEAMPSDGKLLVGALGNFSFMRGYDRLIDVALELQHRGCERIHFAVAGDMNLHGRMPGRLGQLAARGATLADYARAMGVAGFFTFLGHVSTPERVVVGCDVVIKPSRENNPWGRDIIEAMACGKPAIGVGRYDRFVENGMTGLLQHEFDADALADFLIAMEADRERLRGFGHAAQARVRTLCDPQARSSDLLSYWTELSRAA